MYVHPLHYHYVTYTFKKEKKQEEKELHSNPPLLIENRQESLSLMNTILSILILLSLLSRSSAAVDASYLTNEEAFLSNYEKQNCSCLHTAAANASSQLLGCPVNLLLKRRKRTKKCLTSWNRSKRLMKGRLSFLPCEELSEN